MKKVLAMHEQIKTLVASDVAFTRKALPQTVPPLQPKLPTNIQLSVGVSVPWKPRILQS
jgi:hypothetical protein